MQVFKELGTQPVFNEAGLAMLNFLSGLAMYQVVLPLVKARVSYLLLFVDRVLRHLPALVAIVCLDLIWPLTASGPFFTRVSTFVLNKCTLYWWANLTFVHNFLPSLDIVSLIS